MTERKCACNKLFSILVRGPNTENFEKKLYKQCKLGCGPQHREFRKEILQAMQVGDGPQQREIGFPISTDNASRGGTTK
ncbi:hypothetical protein CA803_13305 [Staphylococcus aureus]|nr:hypothetical protein CA803_13305 [Staphylococcus aureus]